MTYAVTDAQQRVLAMIRAFIEEQGYPPTLADICAALGFKSHNSAHWHLKALERRGMVELVPGVRRGIRVKK